MKYVLHVSPHPDDELIGAPGTLFLLQKHGWQVVNLAISLGRSDQRSRRSRELAVACGRAGFELAVCQPLVDISSGADFGQSRELVRLSVERAVDRYEPSIVIGPQDTDGHHGHEVTGLGMKDAIMGNTSIALWQWGLWSDLSEPNLLVDVPANLIARAQWAVSAHEGEVERNNYVELLEARARGNGILGPERVLGWGKEGDSRYCEVLRELRFQNGGLHRSSPSRKLDPLNPLQNAMA